MAPSPSSIARKSARAALPHPEVPASGAAQDDPWSHVDFPLEDLRDDTAHPERSGKSVRVLSGCSDEFLMELHAGMTVAVPPSWAKKLGPLYPNQPLVLKGWPDDERPKEERPRTALAVVTACGGGLKPAVGEGKAGAMGIKSRNKEQSLLFALLADPEVRCLIVTGQAGSGKTLCVAAHCLQTVIGKASKTAASRKNPRAEDFCPPEAPLTRNAKGLPKGGVSKRRPTPGATGAPSAEGEAPVNWEVPPETGMRLLLCKPLEVISSTKYWGTMPGGEQDKFGPFLKSYLITFEGLMGGTATSAARLQRAVKSKTLEFVPLEVMRGASFKNCLLWYDEAQNLDHHEMESLGSRLDDDGGSRLILTADLRQRDKDLAVSGTGLMKLLNSPAFLNSRFTAHINLEKNERGAVSAMFFEVFGQEDDGGRSASKENNRRR
jgi:hypothetical protein